MNASSDFSRRALQVCVALGGLVPVAAGFAGVALGPHLASGVGAVSAPLDSHFRYLSGLLLGIGLGFWSTIPAIEQRRPRFLLLSGIVVIGGLARLFSLLQVGAPDAPMLFGLAMELVVTPALALWQARLAAASPTDYLRPRRGSPECRQNRRSCAAPTPTALPPSRSPTPPTATRSGC